MSIKKTLLLIFLLVFSDKVCAQIKIGVALPFMNNTENREEKNLGAEMLQGINDAVKEHNRNNPESKVELITEDTQRDPAITLEIINKFGSDKKVIAVFGPVFSSELAPNAGAPNFHKIPVITPTSTQNFLAQNNPFLFQLNPTYEVRGRTMAKFANDELKMKRFAVFSEDSYGKNFADSFSEEVLKNGGAITTSVYYSKDDNDLTQELEDLEDKIFSMDKFIDFGNITREQFDIIKNHDIKFSYADSLKIELLVVSIYKLFGRDADWIMDSLKLKPSASFDKSRTVIPGYTEAIYIPISTYLEIPKMISQYFSEHINLPVLGTSDWNNKEILEENKIYIKNLYFDSDFNFRDNAVTPDKLSESGVKNYYFGYDGMKLILDKISEGNKDRLSLKNALESTENYSTFHNKITLKERTNIELEIMRFNKGELVRIGDFKY
ncbi:MAG: ABC transporter substrate-binding protein [Ignavibacteria bacterium]|nr:ABC transporter substrate-binding protein [Ignavibacteria bacterium]